MEDFIYIYEIDLNYVDKRYTMKNQFLTYKLEVYNFI